MVTFTYIRIRVWVKACNTQFGELLPLFFIYSLAGDNVKFGFPMSATVTILAWGLLQYKDAYIASEELGEMYDCIRWPLEWLLKCHTGENELYVQVNFILFPKKLEIMFFLSKS